MSDINHERLLTTREAAAYLNLSERHFIALRRKGEGPAYVKIGYRTIKYSRAALDAFIDDHTQEA